MADNPPTNIFFVLVTIWREERTRARKWRRLATIHSTKKEHFAKKKKKILMIIRDDEYNNASITY